MELWLDEYDELVQDVIGSSYQTFSLHIQRWIDFLDTHDLIAPYLHSWEGTVDFGEWWKAAEQTIGGSVGSGQLNWSRDAKERLGLQLGLFRAFGSGDIQVPLFALHFLYARDGDYNAQAENVAQRLFLPFAKELRRTILKLDLSKPPQDDEGFIPASDRIVKLDHNSAAYKDLVGALEKLESALAAINDYPDPAAQERHIAELSAGKRLLQAGHARVAAIWGTLGPTIRWAMRKFMESEIGHIADQVWTFLIGLS